MASKTGDPASGNDIFLITSIIDEPPEFNRDEHGRVMNAEDFNKLRDDEKVVTLNAKDCQITIGDSGEIVNVDGIPIAEWNQENGRE